ncbi:MAG: hypothetical protein K6F51_09390 [Acetatifactor sp.]|nr:hypothetical protein [Acetatifactor sp.]
MKKTTKRAWNRVLTLVLCTAMILGMTLQHCTIQARAAGGALVAGCSLTVSEGAIGMNLYLSGLSDAGNYVLQVDGVSHPLEKQSDGTYKASHFVTPRNIVKNLSISLYSGSQKISLTNSSAVNGTLTYSVKEYLTGLEGRDDEMGRLAKALDDYGTCAYYYFSGTEDIPVEIPNMDLSSYAIKKSGDVPQGITYAGSCLVLGNTIGIRHYFEITNQITSVQMITEGRELEIVADPEKANRYYVEISDVRAWDIDHAYNLIVVANRKKSTISYSVLTYANVATKAKTDARLVKLVRSIYWYKNAFQECYDTQEITTPYVTYKMFNAKGDGVTDDYDAIVRTHEYANKYHLPVKADPGATYYIGHMNSDNPSGAEIRTDTDWGDATFLVDDTHIPMYDTEREVKKPDGTIEIVIDRNVDGATCALFTVKSYLQSGYKWMNTALWWYEKGDGTWAYHTAKVDGDQHLYLGLDPNLDPYPEHSLGSGRNYSGTLAAAQKNKEFTKDTTVFGAPGEFKEDALYVLETSSVKRWGRNGSGTASSSLRDQEEVVIVRTTGEIDPSTRLQWDWKEISSIKKYPIDQTTLTVTGGKFITEVNYLNAKSYVRRGITVQRSNTQLVGVQHYLAGEDKMFTDASAYVDSDTHETKYHARLGAPYHGFFRVNYCAYVTLKDCIFSNHLRVYSYGSDENSTAPYDFYAEYAAVITLDHCICAADQDDPTGPADKTGIMDDSRWGTMGSNFCKELIVQNGCRLNRVDAHMGTYNVTVKDSTIGYLGIDVIGFGEMNLERVTSYGDFFVNLRRDFGSYWNGDVNITDCTWKVPAKKYSPMLIFTNYQPNPKTSFGYDVIEEDGVKYYCTMPTNVNVNGLTIDASRVTDNAFTGTSGVQIFSCPIMNLQAVVNDRYFKNPAVYKYPLRITKKVSVRNLKILMNPALVGNTFVGVALKQVDKEQHSERFFDNTIFDYNKEKNLTIEAASPWVDDVIW